MLRKYEVMYILRHDAPTEVTQTAIEKIKDTITGEGGTILLHESWGKRKLAYEIEKANKGIYQLTTFAGQASSIRELERVFRIHPQVLRWLTVQLDDNLKDLEAEIAHYATVTPRMEPIDGDENRHRPSDTEEDAKAEKADKASSEDNDDDGKEDDDSDDATSEDDGDEESSDDSDDSDDEEENDE